MKRVIRVVKTVWLAVVCLLSCDSDEAETCDHFEEYVRMCREYDEP